MAVQTQSEVERALHLLRRTRTYLLTNGWRRGPSYNQTAVNRSDGFEAPLCVANALNAVTTLRDRPFHYAFDALREAVRERTGLPVGDYNDVRSRKYSEIIYLLDDAIDSLEGELDELG